MLEINLLSEHRKNIETNALFITLCEIYLNDPKLIICLLRSTTLQVKKHFGASTFHINKRKVYKQACDVNAKCFNKKHEAQLNNLEWLSLSEPNSWHILFMKISFRHYIKHTFCAHSRLTW